MPCWRDGITTQCYVMTENDLNLWADLHVCHPNMLQRRFYYFYNQIKNPITISIDTKPPQINLYNSVRHAHGSQDKHQQQPQMMPPMGFPPMMGAPFFPSGFMNPWQIQQAMMGQASGQELAGFGVNNSMFNHIFATYDTLLFTVTAGLNPHIGAPSKATPAAASDADITFPDAGDWAMYCDRILNRRRAKLGTLRDKLTQQGFFEIDQLTGGRISHSDLAQSLEVGIGIAALIVRWAEEDIAQVQAGTFDMDSV